jgi:signal transduction histidine kinase
MSDFQRAIKTPGEAELRAEIESLRQQLNQAQRLTALGELVSTTTHEFNNVLMSIINYAKLALRQRDEIARDKALQKILSAGERAAKITNSVLGMARNRGNQFQAVELSGIIRETMVLLDRELAKYRIHVRVEMQEVPPALAIGNQIQQVLLNLLINARQAMAEGGDLLIQLKHDPDSNMAELTVRDNGKGIPADKLPHIFEPFFTTKAGPDGSGLGGTGLGLAACRNIVEAHHGRIRVQSTVGKGTAFTIKLPLAAAVPPTSTKPHQANSPVPQ